MKSTLLTSFALAASAGLSQAALITWSGPNLVTDENVIISPSTVVQAYNIGGPALTVTVGGSDVVFAANAGATGPATNLGGGANGNEQYWQGTVAADADFNTVLDTQRWNNTSNQVIPLFGLSIGTEYQVQLFSVDQRDCCRDRTQQWTDGTTNSGVAHRGSSIVTDPYHNLGEYIVGTFTADAATQNFNGLNGGGGDQLNAVVLATIPEPSGVALVGLAGVGLMLRRRRK